MKALTVRPRVPGSAAVTEVAEPPVSDGDLLVEIIEVGVCGTDREIVDGAYGRAPDGDDRLVLGHESFGQILECPANSGFARGDFVVGIVRRPDPVPCRSCAAGEWDMCLNGLYTERGIGGRHGYASERVRLESAFAVKVDPALCTVGVLLEPASVVAKAWDHIDRIGARTSWRPRRVTVLGAGPIGLLGALMGVQRGLEVHVHDRIEEGLKPKLVAALGARYHGADLSAACRDADVILECTGVGQLALAAMREAPAGAIVCLTGISSGHRAISIDAGRLNDSLVLENHVVFGSVNANRRHFTAALDALVRADVRWLERLITRRVVLEDWQSAFRHSPEDVKTVIRIAPVG